jgi:Flp pilus assembly pilin Flp
MTSFIRLLRDESGATIVEYALISAALSAVMIGALATIVSECKNRLSVTSAKMTALGTTPS